MGKGNRIIKKDRKYESYYECERCNITSETEGRMCPCPRGSCEAEAIGEKMTTIKIKRHKPKYCKCGQGAKWIYMPSSDTYPYYCDDCVPRGCSCNNRHLRDDELEPTEEDGIEGKDWKWITKGVEWTKLDDKGREWPCVEFDYDDEENNFGAL